MPGLKPQPCSGAACCATIDKQRPLLVLLWDGSLWEAERAVCAMCSELCLTDCSLVGGQVRGAVRELKEMGGQAGSPSPSPLGSSAPPHFIGLRTIKLSSLCPFPLTGTSGNHSPRRDIAISPCYNLGKIVRTLYHVVHRRRFRASREMPRVCRSVLHADCFPRFGRF